MLELKVAQYYHCKHSGLGVGSPYVVLNSFTLLQVPPLYIQALEFYVHTVLLTVHLSG